jgi:hypothetical protein
MTALPLRYMLRSSSAVVVWVRTSCCAVAGGTTPSRRARAAQLSASVVRSITAVIVSSSHLAVVHHFLASSRASQANCARSWAFEPTGPTEQVLVEWEERSQLAQGLSPRPIVRRAAPLNMTVFWAPSHFLASSKASHANCIMALGREAGSPLCRVRHSSTAARKSL